jgi:hypothetical protein
MALCGSYPTTVQAAMEDASHWEAETQAELPTTGIFPQLSN